MFEFKNQFVEQKIIETLAIPNIMIINSIYKNHYTNGSINYYEY
jgi:hypothetical protein